MTCRDDEPQDFNLRATATFDHRIVIFEPRFCLYSACVQPVKTLVTGILPAASMAESHKE